MAQRGEKPILSALSRRQFLALSGGVVAGILGTEAVVAHAVAPDGHRTFALPECPSHNPGFQGRDLGQEGVLLWTNHGRDGFKAYRLNALGRSVWRMCDGTRNIEMISDDYAKRYSQPRDECVDFVKELARAGIIVADSHIVASGAFVLPDPGKGYHIRLTHDDPGGNG